MKILLTSCFCLMLCKAFGQRSVTADSRTVSYLAEFRKNYAAALKANDPAGATRLFADSIRLMPENQPTVWTKQHVLKYYQGLLSRIRVKDYQPVPLDVMDLGRMIVELGTFASIVQLKSKNSADTVHGKYANIWARDTKGVLLLTAQAWNYSQPLAIADSLVIRDVPSVNMAYQAHIPVKDPLSFELAAYNSFQEKVIMEHDAVRWKQFYTDDFMFLYSNHPVYRGRTEIDAFLDDHVKQLPVFEKLDIRTDRIEDLDGYVLEYATHIAIVRSGDWSGVVTGKNIYIWRRDNNGILRICRGIAMYD
ncbi:MAG: nuclear transport factor 2 family protein [Chitinophagaceae bacterium]|nr:nuclear transport factor 2 family protein [Chitinophagaceae bacterium]